MNPGHPELFDLDLLRQRRDRAAAAPGPAADFLLRDVAQDLMDRLAVIARPFPVAAVLGAHHGVLARLLRARAGSDRVVEVDASRRMLALCDGPRVQAGAEAVPFDDGALDLAVSALTWQSVNDLPGLLAQVRRALRPDGLLLAALAGGATLTELRQSLLAAEAELEGGASPRVAPFADVRDLGQLLQRAQFALPVVDADTIAVTYADPLALMRELRAMGATNILQQRSRKPLARATLARACEIYRARFAAPGGRVRATFEIVTLTGWAPHASQQKPLRPGSAATRLADALGVREMKASRDDE